MLQPSGSQANVFSGIEKIRKPRENQQEGENCRNMVLMFSRQTERNLN